MSSFEKRVEGLLTMKLYGRAGRQKIPLSGTFELTPLCNFSCRMCYVRKTAAEVKAHPRPLRTAAQWIRLAEQAREAGMLYLLLTGGEPLLQPDFTELYEALYKMGFLISINTNGSRITDSVIRMWEEMPPYRVNITLYGASDDTYEILCGVKGMCSRVKNVIAALKRADLSVKLNCSLTPYNAGDLEPMLRFAEQVGVPITVSTYMYPPVRRDASMTGRNDRFTPEEAAYYHLERCRLQRSSGEYRQFLREILQGLAEPPGLDASCVDPATGRIRCRAGSAAFWATWDGFLTPCGMMPEPGLDLEGRNFGDVWKELTGIVDALHTSRVCEQCADRQMCHSCAAMAYTETGSTEGIPVYLCRMMAAMRRQAEEQTTHPVFSEDKKEEES